MSGIFGIFGRKPLVQPQPQVPKRICRIGAFLGDGIPTQERIQNFQQKTGKLPAVVMWFHAFAAGFEFPKEACELVSQFDGLPFIKLEPWSWRGKNDDSFSLARIADGEFDSDIQFFAKGAKRWGKDLALAFGHEMNLANVYPWGGDPAGFTRAWGHVHSIFGEVEAKNVKWVFNPNHYPSDQIRRCFPGTALVDICAIDGFNWGNTRDWSKWEPFSKIFGDAYKILTSFCRKPIWIGEMSSTEQGGNKPSWIKDALASTKNDFPKIETLVWFDFKKETDWRINSTPASAAAFRRAISDQFFIGGNYSAGK